MSLQIVDVASGDLRQRFNFPLRSIDFTSDGATAVLGMNNGSIWFWSLAENKELRRFSFSGGSIVSLDLSHDDSTLLAGQPNGTLHLLDAVTGEMIRRWERIEGDIKGCALSPDGRHVAWVTGARSDVFLVDLQDPGHTYALQGHRGSNVAVKFTADGRHLLSAGFDATIRLWNVKTQTEIARFDGHTNHVEALAPMPDGRHLLSAGEDGTVRLLRLPKCAWPIGENSAASKGVRRFPQMGADKKENLPLVPFSDVETRLLPATECGRSRVHRFGDGRHSLFLATRSVLPPCSKSRFATCYG